MRQEVVGDCVLYHGDCCEVIPQIGSEFADSIVIDPPYGLEFMGKEWDKLGACAEHPDDGEGPWGRTSRVRYGRQKSGSLGQAMQQFYFDVASAWLPALKPGGYMLCFGGTRTYHRLACAAEDAGFEIRDCLMWLYGTGFPKAKSCLKPAYEPILLCRKPGKKMLPLGIEDCRIAVSRNDVEAAAVPQPAFNSSTGQIYNMKTGSGRNGEVFDLSPGRYPANVAHDGSNDVEEVFAEFGESKTPARFFFCAKASRKERGPGNTHPTVKPLALMEWLVKLVTPVGGVCFDPMMGSATTMLACLNTGRRGIGIENDDFYFQIATGRISSGIASDTPAESES